MPGFRLSQVRSSLYLSLPGKKISGTIRVSQVPQCFSSYMPRPLDTGRPSRFSPIIEPFVLASVVRITSPSASINVTMLYHASGEHLSPCGLYDSLCTLRVSRSTFVDPSHSRNTRYGWLAKPCPAGTCTLQETPGLAWRTRNYFSESLYSRIIGNHALELEKKQCVCQTAKCLPRNPSIASG